MDTDSIAWRIMASIIITAVTYAAEADAASLRTAPISMLQAPIYVNITSTGLMAQLTAPQGCAAGQFMNWTNGTASLCGTPAAYDDINLWLNASNLEARVIAIEGWDISNASLWLNTSDLEARIIVLEAANGSGAAYNDTLLWANASDQDGRIITLETASSTHNDGITLLWANASDQDGRLIAIEARNASNFNASGYVPYANASANLDMTAPAMNVSAAKFIGINSLLTGVSSASSFLVGRMEINSTVIRALNTIEGNGVGVTIRVNQTLNITSWNPASLTISGPTMAMVVNRAEQGARIVLSPVSNNFTYYGAALYQYGEDQSGPYSKGLTYDPQVGTMSFNAYGNKNIDLGQSDNSWNTCYCDDHTTTPRDLISLEENNKGDFSVKTFTKGRDNNGLIIEKEIINHIDSSIKSKNAKIYNSYFDVIKDIPYYENNGSVDFYSIPLMLRDKKGNNDTISDYGFIMAVRNALIEKDTEIQSLKTRLDKLEGLKE